MPAYTGWFAGRALVISQVTTDFFIWVDDDFVFTSETDIQYMIDVITKTGIICAVVSRVRISSTFSVLRPF